MEIKVIIYYIYIYIYISYVITISSMLLMPGYIILMYSCNYSKYTNCLSYKCNTLLSITGYGLY